MKKEIVAIFHNIRSVHNVGSMFRSADGAGISRLYLTGHTPTPIDQFGFPRKDIAKVALGAEKTIDWEYEKDIMAIIKKLRTENFYIIALEQAENSINCEDLKIKGEKAAILVGNEIEGIDKKILSECDVIAEIPMLGEKESLNVSVAFGIIVFSL